MQKAATTLLMQSASTQQSEQTPQTATTTQDVEGLQQEVEGLELRIEGLEQETALRLQQLNDALIDLRAEIAWTQAASEARALNATATYTPLALIAPKPGKPAYDDADFPVYANAVQTLPEDSCDRLAMAWGIEFAADASVLHKRGEIGRFIGCHVHW